MLNNADRSPAPKHSSRPVQLRLALSHDVDQLTLGIPGAEQRRPLVPRIEFTGRLIERADLPHRLRRSRRALEKAKREEKGE